MRISLDWKNAFDSIEPERLMIALEKFGVDEAMRKVIANIYENRCFHVKGGARYSDSRRRMAGIRHGGLRSPFLVGTGMAILMTDAQQMLSPGVAVVARAGLLEDELFADDAFLTSSGRRHLQEYMVAVTECGSQYGLQVHWGEGTL